MSGFWLVSYLVLWLVIIGGGLAFLAMAWEIETLHKKLDTLEKYLHHNKPENEK